MNCTTSVFLFPIYSEDDSLMPLFQSNYKVLTRLKMQMKVLRFQTCLLRIEMVVRPASLWSPLRMLVIRLIFGFCFKMYPNLLTQRLRCQLEVSWMIYVLIFGILQSKALQISQLSANLSSTQKRRLLSILLGTGISCSEMTIVPVSESLSISTDVTQKQVKGMNSTSCQSLKQEQLLTSLPVNESIMQKVLLPNFQAFQRLQEVELKLLKEMICPFLDETSLNWTPRQTFPQKLGNLNRLLINAKENFNSYLMQSSQATVPKLVERRYWLSYRQQRLLVQPKMGSMNMLDLWIGKGLELRRSSLRTQIWFSICYLFLFTSSLCRVSVISEMLKLMSRKRGWMLQKSQPSWTRQALIVTLLITPNCVYNFDRKSIGLRIVFKIFSPKHSMLSIASRLSSSTVLTFFLFMLPNDTVLTTLSTPSMRLMKTSCKKGFLLDCLSYLKVTSREQCRSMNTSVLGASSSPQP